MKFLKKAKEKVTHAITKVNDLAGSAKLTLKSRKAEGYVDSGVKILIAVVIGALLLAGLYALFNSTIMPTVSAKITELFNYNGAAGRV